MNISTIIKTTAVALCLVASVSLAEDRRPGRALSIQGYYGITAVSVVDPDDPAILHNRWAGEGGLTHIGKVTVWSTDEIASLATLQVTNHSIFQDEEGDQIWATTTGSGAFQPDGRITLEATATVLGGTGPYEHATGTLSLTGWVRYPNPQTLESIGFITVNGTIHAKELKRWGPATLADSGSAQVNGLDFVYNGDGQSQRFGHYAHTVRSVAGPVNGFVGIISNKFAVAIPIEEAITVRGAELRGAGFEFVYLEIMTLPDGSPAPDFSKPSTFETYSTFTGGTRRFEEAQGVLKTTGTLTPTSPTTMLATATSQGFARIKGTERGR